MRLIGLVLFLIGVVFIVESLVIMYVLSLFPSYLVQEVSQFALLGWTYGMVKLIVGLVSLVAGIMLVQDDRANNR